VDIEVAYFKGIWFQSGLHLCVRAFFDYHRGVPKMQLRRPELKPS